MQRPTRWALSYPLLLLSPIHSFALSPPFAFTILSRASLCRIKTTAASTVSQHFVLARCHQSSTSSVAGGLRSCATGSFSRFCGLSSRLPAFQFSNRPLLSAASRLQSFIPLKLCSYYSTSSSSPATFVSSRHEPTATYTPGFWLNPAPQPLYTKVTEYSPSTTTNKKKKKKQERNKENKKRQQMYTSSSDDDKPLARNGNRTNGRSHSIRRLRLC